MSHQKTKRYGIFVDDEGYTINCSHQTFEQLYVIQEIILPEVSKLNDSVVIKTTRSIEVLSKKAPNGKKNGFFLKSKIDSPPIFLLSPNNITSIDESCYKIIVLAILQIFFQLSKNFNHLNCRTDTKVKA